MDDALAVEHLRALIRIPTVSRADESQVDAESFTRFRAELARLYPRVHALGPELVAGGSLLFRWPGRDPQAGEPAVLMAHYDVVPADVVPADAGPGGVGWTYPPFAAELVGDGAEQRVWGRGAIDDKGMLCAILEAVDDALAAGVRPERDVYLSLGHNEETQGAGAAAIVDLLKSRGVRAGLVIDEGGAIVEGLLPGVVGPIAMIGLSEKGVAGVELIAEKRGGHAATPAPNGATAVLARAILRLEAHPARVSLPEPSIAYEPRAPREAAGTLLSQLSPQERAAVVLKDVFDFSLDEIAGTLATTPNAIKAALHRGRGKLLEPEVDAAPVAPAVLDAFCAAFNARDLDQMTALLLDTSIVELPGLVIEVGPAAAKAGIFTGTLFGCPAGPHAELPRARCEVRAHRGEAIFLWWLDDRVDTIVRVAVDGERIARLTSYYHAPEVIAEVCRELALPFTTHGYHYWSAS